MNIYLPVAFLAVLLVTPLMAQQHSPSFSRDIVPIFKARCVACHMTGTEPGKLSLVPAKAYSSIVQVKAQTAPMTRVVPAAPDRSYLVRKLEGTHLKGGGSGGRMPLGGMPLPPEKMAAIRQWVADGARNN